MIESIVIEFEQVTKFPLLQFMREYQDFMLNSYGLINDYFSGKTEKIANEHIRALKNLTVKTSDVMSQFKNFANKFEKCGYWELMDIIDTLNNTIETINKLPKYRKTVLAKRGYTPSVETNATVGGMRTMDDIADSLSGLNGENTGWVELMLNNDLNEDDWEIDKLSSLKVYVNNTSKIVVTTIIDTPTGKKVYGKDLLRKIEFKNNDFKLAEYEDNIEQKCQILLELNRGDVPENMLFGKNPLYINQNVQSLLYPAIAQDIRKLFMQNDLFESAEMTDIKFENGSLNIVVEIKTKYEYSTEKTLTL